MEKSELIIEIEDSASMHIANLYTRMRNMNLYAM